MGNIQVWVSAQKTSFRKLMKHLVNNMNWIPKHSTNVFSADKLVYFPDFPDMLLNSRNKSFRRFSHLFHKDKISNRKMKRQQKNKKILEEGGVIETHSSRSPLGSSQI